MGRDIKQVGEEVERRLPPSKETAEIGAPLAAGTAPPDTSSPADCRERPGYRVTIEGA